MDLFINHKLTKIKDGYLLELYLDEGLSEFAQEFYNIEGKKSRDNEIGIEDYVFAYIKEKFPNLKIKAINIMLGSILLSSVSVGSSYALTNNDYNITYSQSIYSYRVKYGDTLYKIANRYGTNISKIKALNNLTSDNIQVGQILKIPNDSGGFYSVLWGDTLYKIALRYGLNIDQLKMVNNLKGDLIYPGQKLYIPGEELLDIINNIPSGIYKEGYNRHEIKYIQIAFNTLGYGLTVDGYYGTRMKTVILDFQTQYNGLENDGIYGPKTREYLIKSLFLDHFVVENPADVLVLVNKQYSLPKGYTPENLVVPDVLFPFDEFHEKKLMRKDAAKALEELFSKAKQDGIKLYATSGYRSYNRQNYIFTSKVMKYGMKVANEYSAKPGESEHQTGLSMDVTSPGVNYKLSHYFGETKEGLWLKENAKDFGFIIRYPQGKESITGYKYEPWHIRYVGRDVANILYNKNLTLEEFKNKSQD